MGSRHTACRYTLEHSSVLALLQTAGKASGVKLLVGVKGTLLCAAAPILKTRRRSRMPHYKHFYTNRYTKKQVMHLLTLCTR